MTKIAEIAGILDGVERQRHPGERRDWLQHLDERIERLARDQRRHADQEAERNRERSPRTNSRDRTRPMRIADLDAKALVIRARCRRTARLQVLPQIVVAPTSSGPGIADLPWVACQPHQLGVFRVDIGGWSTAARLHGNMPGGEDDDEDRQREHQRAQVERRRHSPSSVSPGWSAGRGPSGQRNSRCASVIATSLIEGLAPRHAPVGGELPVLIAMRAEPVAAVIVRFIVEAHGDARAVEGPYLLDQAVVELALPFSLQEGGDRPASGEELGAIASAAVGRVGRRGPYPGPGGSRHPRRRAPWRPHSPP